MGVTHRLAIALAMEVNQTVPVVDADLRNPSVGWYLGLDVGKGLLDYLHEDIPLGQLLLTQASNAWWCCPGKVTRPIHRSCFHRLK